MGANLGIIYQLLCKDDNKTTCFLFTIKLFKIL